MKATDILRDHILDLERMILVFDEYAMYKSRDESKKAVQELTQIITELEELQNRSCKNCFYFNSKYQLLDINNSITNRCEKLSLYVTDDFCCNKWESK